MEGRSPAWQQDLWTKTSRKPVAPFSTMAALGSFREISACPLSSKSVLECCVNSVIPVLLYGCENWILTEPLCQKLESLQSELVKRKLKWPKYLSNTAALTTLDVPTVRSKRKLSFLHRVVNSNPFSLSGRTVLALSQLSLSGGGMQGAGGSDIRATIHDRDLQQNATKCSVKAPIIAEVANRVGWSKLWDVALDIGVKSIRGLQCLSRAMYHHGRGDHPCPRCDAAPLGSTLLQHLLDCHSTELFLDHNITQESLMQQIEDLHLNSLCNFSKLYVF